MRREKLEELQDDIKELKAKKIKLIEKPEKKTFLKIETYQCELENGSLLEREKLKKGKRDGSAAIILPITKEKNRVQIIKSIKDDDKKIALLGSITKEIDITDIIKTIQDDNKKIKLLDSKMIEINRAHIIQSLQDDDKKIGLLATIRNQNTRYRIIEGLQIDDKKIEALSYLEDLDLKIKAIKTLNDYTKKDYVINKIDKATSLESPPDSSLYSLTAQKDTILANAGIPYRIKLFSVRGFFIRRNKYAKHKAACNNITYEKSASNK